jgi:hypothetical protein
MCGVIVDSPIVARDDFESRTGWHIKPQGACKAEMCVPLAGIDSGAPTFDLRELAPRLGMPLIEEPAHNLWGVGPESIGRAIQTAEAPELILPDRNGNDFTLSSLRGQKVLLLAWASW